MKKKYIENNNILINKSAKDFTRIIDYESGYDLESHRIKIMGAFDFKDNFNEIGKIHQVSKVGNYIEIRVVLDKKLIKKAGLGTQLKILAHNKVTIVPYN